MSFDGNEARNVFDFLRGFILEEDVFCNLMICHCSL